MTNEQLDKLDKLAAEKVMGWEVLSHSSEEKHQYVYDGTVLLYLTGEGCTEYRRPAWQPTRNIAQAWELLEKLPEEYSVFIEKMDMYRRKQGYSIVVVKWPKPNEASYGEQIAATIQDEGYTAPLAITLACLRAMGVEV